MRHDAKGLTGLVDENVFLEGGSDKLDLSGFQAGSSREGIENGFDADAVDGAINAEVSD